ncbi:MAG TPA: AMP-binding protein [Solirubrobacteraceae bacterium]|jgi:acyl-CoA synthetase (AMP-forming)/AMP-acid ligase II
MSGLAAKLHRTARWHSERIAAIDGEREASFGTIESRSNRLANGLLGLSEDVGGQAGPRGGRVALLLPNSLEYIEADLAIVKAGKAKVPINVRLTPDERAYVMRDSGAELLITDEAGLASIAEGHREQLPDLHNVLVVGPDACGQTGYEALLQKASDAPPGLPEDPDAPSVILYTSGTTGRPKGAASSFRSRWLTTVNMLVSELDVAPGDGMIHAGSMAHGSGSKALAFFLSGARNIAMRKFDGEAFFDLVERHGATHTFLVPTMIATLLEASRSRSAPSPALKTLSYGGAPIAEPLLREALAELGGALVQVYGSCEAPHPITILSKADHAELIEGRAASIGRESLAVETLIADADGQPVADGEPGELLVGGPSVMSGYWNASEATARAFVDGHYRTGDVARRDEHGYLYIVDRQREMIITGGLNVYPAEVERVLCEHDAVAEVAVIGVPDERWGESVMAVVVASPNAPVGEEDLLEHCRARLAGYKKPRHVSFVERLPKGSTGKVLKRELRQEFWEGRSRMVN